jgi:nucleotide-binding universal stress UspA family protein
VAPLLPVYCEAGFGYPAAADDFSMEKTLQTRLQEFASEEFPRLQTRCVVLEGEPARVIVDYAQDHQADLIALPTHGYGLFRRALLGSVTSKVLHDSTVPVWTSAHCSEASHRAHPQPRLVIAAVDLKEKTPQTLEAALALARDAGAAVEVIHYAKGQVSAELPEREMAYAVGAAALADAVQVEQPTSASVQLVNEGEGIASFVRTVAQQKRADLVVIGRARTHGNLLDRLHSHAYSVVCESPCPVLSV